MTIETVRNLFEAKAEARFDLRFGNAECGFIFSQRAIQNLKSKWRIGNRRLLRRTINLFASVLQQFLETLSARQFLEV